MAQNIGYLMKGKITEHFALWEFCNSESKDEVKLVLTPRMVEHIQMLEELREVLGYPLDVSSGYRTKEYNERCGGDKNSAHLDGLATDITSIPQSDIGVATCYWECICKSHGKVGGINYYAWGVHVCSDEGRFGHKEFVIRDKR